jgi:MFS family permease
MRTLTYGELIRENRNFRNLLAGQFISELGNWFNFIAGLGLVRLVSDASPTAAGVFFVARLLPFALASPIAGTFVDRFSRRQVMIASDLLRVVIALSFLLVTSRENLWIAYLATVLLHTLGAFFDGAKNASAPNLAGKEGLLAATALLFSTRFLLMAIGSALGGWAAAVFGYQAAFIINAASFLISAYTVWLIPEEATRDEATGERMSNLIPRRRQTPPSEQPNFVARAESRDSFITELREGLSYSVKNHFALTILIMNMIWATGGGSINVIYERFGGVYFAEIEKWKPDLVVTFIGWTLIIHGVLFAFGGFTASIWIFLVIVFVSRAIVGVEYAVQETLFQRSLPDYIRGRISTLDRGAEMTVFGLSSFVASEAMYYITPQTLTVISGILSALAGIVWFVRERKRPDVCLA